MNESEVGEKCWGVVETDGECKSVSVRERHQGNTTTKTLTFDKVFGPLCRQVDVYSAVVESTVKEIIMGYNCTIFA